jgi:hypothetical protein
LVDDLDGSASDDISTVEFGLDGVSYEIDLNEPNAGKLRGAVEEYVARARRTGGRLKRGVRPKTENGNGVSEASQIREWALANGVELAARGRIPSHVVESYHEVQRAAAVSTKPRRTRAKKV